MSKYISTGISKKLPDSKVPYIEEASSVHHRYQTTVQFMAVALSTKELLEQITELCPQGTPIPSDTWVRYQIYPRCTRRGKSTPGASI